MKKILFAILSLLVISCQREVTDIPLPESKAKLVVNCILCPQDDTLSLTLQWSQPLFGNSAGDTSLLSRALVTLSGGGLQANMNFDGLSQTYRLARSQFNLKDGVRYYLYILLPDGRKVSANCEMPVGNITDCTQKKEYIQMQFGSSERLTTNFYDIPGQSNYYSIYTESVYHDTTFYYDTVYSRITYEVLTKNDAGKDGAEMQFVQSIYVGETNYIDPNLFYDTYLMNVDSDYYVHLVSLSRYNYDSPFNEPSPIYSNIEGGLGIFGACQRSKFRVP